MTIGSVLREATQSLRAIDPEDAPFEARLMVAHLLNATVPVLASLRGRPWPSALPPR